MRKKLAGCVTKLKKYLLRPGKYSFPFLHLIFLVTLASICVSFVKKGRRQEVQLKMHIVTQDFNTKCRTRSMIHLTFIYLFAVKQCHLMLVMFFFVNLFSSTFHCKLGRQFSRIQKLTSMKKKPPQFTVFMKFIIIQFDEFFEDDD